MLRVCASISESNNGELKIELEQIEIVRKQVQSNYNPSTIFFQWCLCTEHGFENEFSTSLVAIPQCEQSTLGYGSLCID